jgi:purine/pyrimidine-nucleoside phosphorylase
MGLETWVSNKSRNLGPGTAEDLMKHSSYFDGKVQSLGFNSHAGYATAGVIEPGTYKFSTEKQEIMVITAGALRAKLPGKEWLFYKKGEKFTVPPGVEFEVQAKADCAYICYYK